MKRLGSFQTLITTTDENSHDLAAEMSMPIATMHRWQRVGWVASRKVTAAGGRWAIFADADEMLRLRKLRDAPRGWQQPHPKELITPKTKAEK